MSYSKYLNKSVLKTTDNVRMNSVIFCQSNLCSGDDTKRDEMVGTLTCYENFRNPCQVLFGNPENFKQQEKTGHKRATLVKVNFMDWIYVAHEWVQWQDREWYFFCKRPLIY